MITFRKFLQEDFKSSQIIKINVSGKDINISYDNISGKKINFLQYLGTFLKVKGYIRGVLFIISGKLVNFCWEEDLTHYKIVNLLKPKFPNLNLVRVYNDTSHSDIGDKISDNFCFTYTYSNGLVRSTFEEDTLKELEKQKKITKIFGFSKDVWKDILDTCGGIE